MAAQPRKRSKKPTHRLEELDVREVSLVDRPANQKPFVIVKCEGGIPTELPEAEEMARRSAVAASESTPGVVIEKTKGGVVIEIDDISQLDPLDVVDDDEETHVDKNEAEGDEADTDDTGEGEEDSDSDQLVIKASTLTLVSESLTRLMDVVNAISKADALEDTHTAELRDIAKALSPEANTADVTAEDARKVTTDALSKLMTTVNLVKALDDEIDALPDAVTKQIDEIAANLNGVAASTIEKNNDEVTNPESDEPKIIVYKSERDDGDLDLVIKRGAKMKTTRLSKLREAHAMLSKLIEELEGEQAASDGGKKKKTTKSDDTQEGVDVEALVSEVTGAVKKTIADVAKTINETLNGLKGEIDTVTKRMDEADGTVPDGHADDDETGDDDPEAVKKAKEKEASFDNILGITG